MRNFYSALFAEDKETTIKVDSNTSFSATEVYWNSDSYNDELVYQKIVFGIFRIPKNIILHVQRIHFTYSRKLAEQLYAALVDLLWVLDGKGKPLSNRMIKATHSLLSEVQNTLLGDYQTQLNRTIFKGNKFSIFTLGLLGTNILLSEQNKKISDHDPLLLAQDYIEYSQLDAAIKTLEAGIFESPDREELQTELLELYEVTKDSQAFALMHSKLLGKKIKLSIKWQNLAKDFEGQVNEE
jgi:hypothetical protein